MAPFVNKLRRCQSVSAIHYALQKQEVSPSKAYTMKRYSSNTDIAALSAKRSTSCARLKDFSATQYHQRDYDLHDDFWWENRFFNSPRNWPFTYSSVRRYNAIDGSYPLWRHQPGLWRYPNWGNYLNNEHQLDGKYWHRYHNLDYDRPWWNTKRYEYKDIPRSLAMHREGLLDFADMDKHYLQPSYYRRRAFNAGYGNAVH